ncbi:hypothetical protein FB561_1089 [Kribbella amoyensis]|uniref:MFS transporter n=1 Tax=Kribbella amoyensis TaxID=996641 RepID=A0A561BMF4_9ACTN|nr:hypothetical protein [Kribbella amoyensis]TWD80023.1 hypothetical protein FB561_1089 [Kribbella amoyensis]
MTSVWFGRFLLAMLALPTLKSALGVDGGAVFQILAVEDLGASPAAIGTALGLGVVSVPIQIWAARMPISVSQRNLIAFFGVVAAAAGLLAVMVFLARSGTVATAIVVVGLSVTVVAELAVSVLFATSWQPLLSLTLTSTQRQNVNSRGRAAGSAVLVAVLLLFGAGDSAVRVAILVGVMITACAIMLMLRKLPMPGPGNDAPVTVGESTLRPLAGRGGVPRDVVPLLVFTGFAVASAWPLFPVYAAKVFWPSADLGVIGAVEIGVTIAVAALWRPTAGNLFGRARVSVAALVVVALCFVGLPSPEGSGIAGMATLALFAVAVACRDVALLAMLELVHRAVDRRTSVRTLTILDVVESTSLQAALFAGGLMITWSASVSLGATDPYRLYVLAITVGAAIAFRGAQKRRTTPVAA